MDVRYALLLHGRAGTWDQSPSESLHARGGPRKASRRLIRFCAETHLAHIVQAVGAPVDVFIHTWHPELATFIDGIYGEALRGSQRQSTVATKAQSQALSIGKVLPSSCATAPASSRSSCASTSLCSSHRGSTCSARLLLLRSGAACIREAASKRRLTCRRRGAADLQLRSSEPASARWKRAYFGDARSANSWANRHMGGGNMAKTTHASCTTNGLPRRLQSCNAGSSWPHNLAGNRCAGDPCRCT